MGLHKNVNLNVNELVDFLRSQKPSIELLNFLSSQTLLSYKPLSYKKPVFNQLKTAK